MVTKDSELSKKETQWLSEFKKILNRKPKGIELVLDDISITIWMAGAHEKHLGSAGDSFGMVTNPIVQDMEIASFKTNKIIPYSEGQ